MNTKQIDYVLEIAKTKNFNRAAENLFISQPALTYQIKLVEDEIGFLLFERSVRGTVLTPAGEQFCTTLRNIRNELKRAIEQGQNFSSRYQTNISIGL
ncbi:MAG: LysR family transcriptional regulator, partial [Synergistaceae bacterium]|nr:LysR family transcriptional regulator [Synergistaceae bacterium]